MHQTLERYSILLGKSWVRSLEKGKISFSYLIQTHDTRWALSERQSNGVKLLLAQRIQCVDKQLTWYDLSS